jgi:hypothetical protein
VTTGKVSVVTHTDTVEEVVRAVLKGEEAEVVTVELDQPVNPAGFFQIYRVAGGRDREPALFLSTLNARPLRKMNYRPSPQQIKQPDRPKLVDIMRPGLITGASDDDPSGIATYSQAGAQFGYSLGWTLLLTYPLMCAIQMISAQVGRVTGKGLAGNMRRHYPALVIYPLIALLLIANAMNIRAHHRAMAAALRLLVVGPQLAFVAAFAIVTVLLEVFMRYSRYASVLRWLAPSLLAYVATVFAVEVPWLTVAHNLVVPHIKFSGTISQSSWRFLARHQPLSVLAGGRRGRGRERRSEGGPVG